MGIVEKYTYVKWNSCNKQRYINLNYNFTKMGDYFKVKISDLTISSMAMITPICDECGYINEKPIKYDEYSNKVKKTEGVYRCRTCARKLVAKNLITPIEDIKSKLENIHDGKINIIDSSYIRANKNSIFFCNLCGCTWSTTPNNIISKHHNCPDCAKRNTTETRAKNHLKKFLDINVYKIESQKTFYDLKCNGYPLRFDISVTDTCLNKIYLIELQGEQHYRIVDFSGKKNLAEQEQEFGEILKRDKLKEEYVNKHSNMLLIKVPYWEYKNIEKYLKELLSTFQIAFLNIPNEIKNYTYEERFKIAEKIREYKFIINKNANKKELIKMFGLCNIFDVKETTAQRKIAEILNGNIMYEESNYKEHIDAYSTLSKQQKSANSIKTYFTKEQEKDICELYKKGISMQDIANKFSVQHSMISILLKNNDVEIRDNTLKIIGSKSILNKEQVKEIKLMLKDKNNKVKDIAKLYNVKDDVIYKIKLNKTWNNVKI